MLPQQIIDAALSFSSSAEAKKQMKTYSLLGICCKIVGILCLPALGLAYYFHNRLLYAILTGLLFCVVILYYRVLKRGLGDSLRALLDTECRAADYCDRYYAMLCHTRSPKFAVEQVTNFAHGLLCCGRMDDAFAVMAKLPSPEKNIRDILRYHYFYCDYDYETQNEQDLIERVSVLQAIASRARVMPPNEAEQLQLHASRLMVLQMEQQQKWKELSDTVHEAKYLRGTMLAQCDMHRLLARCAAASHDTETERECLRFVADHGGQLHYAAQCREKLASLGG